MTTGKIGWYDNPMPYKVTLKKGKEKLPMKHHPWIFSGAISSVEPGFAEGDWAEVYASDGRFIAQGWYDEKSHIILHLISWLKDRRMDEGFIRELVMKSVERRNDLMRDQRTNALRLIHGEADFLPGVAADFYAEKIRIVISSRFGYHFLPVIASALQESMDPEIIEAVVDRSYAGSEGLKEGVRRFINGKETDKKFEVENDWVFLEDNLLYCIEPGCGQKTGFYCDQRDNRMIAERYAEGRTVLDLFSFTGGFTMHMLRGNCSSVTSVDSSAPALQQLLYHARENELQMLLPEGSADKITVVTDDCFSYLRSVKEDQYDMMILDPPKLAKTKGALENALKAYKDLNRVAMLKIRNEGIIATFSCSGALSREDFRMVLGWAATDAGVEIQILHSLSAGADHPVRLSFPESEYLKGFIIKVLKD